MVGRHPVRQLVGWVHAVNEFAYCMSLITHKIGEWINVPAAPL
jgi:hypothetical protein